MKDSYKLLLLVFAYILCIASIVLSFKIWK
jgi:hypothetical protein